MDSIQAPLVVLLENVWFQALMATLILSNAIFIGVSTDYPGRPEWMIINNAFLLAFTAELLIRLGAFGLKGFFIASPDLAWNLLDFFIVFIGWSDAVQTQLVADGEASNKGSGFSTLFRMFRLLRILRIFKIIRFLKQLYLLAYGFIEAGQAVLWVTCLMGFVLYVCGIVLTRTLGRLPSDDVNYEFFSLRFCTVPTSMLTLFEIMSTPDISVYSDVMAEYPCFAAFLVVFIIFGSFGMIALLTGVISESMFEKNQLRMHSERLEREVRRKVITDKCRALFNTVPLTDEGEALPAHLRTLLPQLAKAMDESGIDYDANDLEQVVDIMDPEQDEHGNRTVSQSQFLHSIISIAADIRPMSFLELHAQVNKTNARLDSVLHSVRKITTYNEDSSTMFKVLRTQLQHQTKLIEDMNRKRAANSSDADLVDEGPEDSGLVYGSGPTDYQPSDVVSKFASFESALLQLQTNITEQLVTLSGCVGDLMLQAQTDPHSPSPCLQGSPKMEAKLEARPPFSPLLSGIEDFGETGSSPSALQYMPKILGHRRTTAPLGDFEQDVKETKSLLIDVRGQMKLILDSKLPASNLGRSSLGAILPIEYPETSSSPPPEFKNLREAERSVLDWTQFVA